ncbi:hypothetical protein BJF95_02615 [Rhizobium oryziradicis]|uniref:Uncharacterized protein n=1 Tax=Rhizobium oryziradicis TaxID=1867956 RepID=A0A1Q8ZVH3_9HYPH|nr:hypothetical protein BJF95_02615 [Rhizobium oryziradicis]
MYTFFSVQTTIKFEIGIFTVFSRIFDQDCAGDVFINNLKGILDVLGRALFVRILAVSAKVIAQV